MASFPNQGFALNQADGNSNQNNNDNHNNNNDSHRQDHGQIVSSANSNQRFDGRNLPFQTSSFFYPNQINAKNMSANYLKNDQQAIQNRPLPTNQAQNVFVPSGTAMIQANRGRKRKLPTETAIASASASGPPSQSGTPAPSAGIEGDDEGEEEEETTSISINPASRTIVIHPGSHFTRVGKATDAYPLTIPTALARRSKVPGVRKRIQRSRPMQPSIASSSAHGNDLQPPFVASTKARGEGMDLDENDEGDEDEDELLTERKDLDPLSSKIELLRADLRSIMRSSRLRPVTNGIQYAANYNLDAKPQRISDHNDLDSDGSMWTEETKGNDVRIGEAALRLPCFSRSHQASQATGASELSSASREWNLFRPFRSGLLDFETYEEHYGKSSAKRILLNDVRTLWEHIISAPTEETVQEAKAAQVSSSKGGFAAAAAAAAAGQASENSDPESTSYGLGIPRKEWSTYGVILIVPDLYSRSDCRNLVELLLSEMGFGAAFIQTESVAVTFGAGSSATCVVRLGGARSQVSCVDEGLVIAESRIALNYGGDDVTSFFKELLLRANFSYKEIDIENNLTDHTVLDDLKQRTNTLDISQFGLNINSIMLRLPSQPTFQYSIRTYDEVVLAPMSLFNTRVIDFEEKRSSLPVLERMEKKAAGREEGDWDNVALLDRLDAKVSTVAMQSSVSHLLQPPQPQVDPSSAPSQQQTESTQQNGADQGNQAQTPAPSSEPSMPANLTSQAAANSSQSSDPKSLTIPQINVPWEASKVPLDVAIWNSLLATSNGGFSATVAQERVRRFASNIVCFGGTALIPGLAGAIEARLNNHLANWHLSLGLDPNSPPYSTVVPAPRELDPRVLAWKGMAVLARLDSVQEMWIRRNDWDKLGWRALKEKTLFF